MPTMCQMDYKVRTLVTLESRPETMENTKRATSSTLLSATARALRRRAGTWCLRSRWWTRKERVFPTRPSRHSAPMTSVLQMKWNTSHDDGVICTTFSLRDALNAMVWCQILPVSACKLVILSHDNFAAMVIQVYCSLYRWSANYIKATVELYTVVISKNKYNFGLRLILAYKRAEIKPISTQPHDDVERQALAQNWKILCYYGLFSTGFQYSPNYCKRKDSLDGVNDRRNGS